MPVVYDDAGLRAILAAARVIAVVGHSPNPARTSYRIAAYLRRVGYHVYPVNPTVTHIDGEPVYPSLADLPEPVDVVNVFRRAEYLPGVVDEALALTAPGGGPPAVWGQLGVLHPAAARLAEGGDLRLVMDRCIMVEHRRLLGLRT